MKQLVRSTTDKKIGGVCGGLGKSLNIDPLILRIVFAVSILFGGIGLVVYILFWVLAPEQA